MRGAKRARALAQKPRARRVALNETGAAPSVRPAERLISIERASLSKVRIIATVYRRNKRIGAVALGIADSHPRPDRAHLANPFSSCFGDIRE